MMKQGKKKQNTVKKFFQIDASEAEDEESEADDDSVDSKERAEAEKAAINMYERKTKMPEIMNLNETELKKRYDDRSEEDEEDDEDDMILGERNEKSGQLHQQRHLPGDEDPKVFAVKCRENMEKDSVFRLMNKFMYLLINNSVDLKIFSVSSIEKFPGYVYIESRSEVNVRNAIKV